MTNDIKPTSVISVLH